MPVSYDTFGGAPTTLVQLPGVNVADFPFNTPGRDATETASLDFQADPAGSCVFDVEINGGVVLAGVSLNTNNPRAMRGNFSGATLNGGQVNNLTVTLVSGTTDLTVSDFMVIFKTP